MPKEGIRRPCEQAMNRVLARTTGTIVEIILRLAWTMGLSATEIVDLKWSEVSFADRIIHLLGRSLPIDDELFAALELHYQRAELYHSEYVVSSDRLHKQMTRMSISRLARNALDEEGLTDITLTDLRDDYILRLLEQHDWTYVAHISGISVRAAKLRYSDHQQPKVKKNEPTTHRPTKVDEAYLLNLAQSGSAEGLAIWMGWKLSMRMTDAVELTWKQIDMKERRILLPEQTLHMDDVLYQQLRRLQAERNPDEDSVVLVTPRSKRPYTLDRLSVVIKDALLRGGMEGVTFLDLITFSRAKRKTPEATPADDILMSYAKQHGNIPKNKGEELLQGTGESAYIRLQYLANSGKLVQVGTIFYVPGTVVPPCEQYEVIRAYLQANGPSFLRELNALLHLNGRQCEWILHGFVEEGKLIKQGRRYVLPAEHTENT